MINLALIGVGQWGKNFITTIDTIPNSRLKYICATSSDTLNALSGKYIKTNDYKDLYKYSDIDGIIIATPGSTHFKIASEFIKRDFNVLIEKPLSTNYKDALNLQKIFNEKKVKVLIGHTLLYNPAFAVFQNLSKKIGKIRYIKFNMGNFGPFRSDISVLWDWGPHAISACLAILNKEPIKLRAWGLKSLKLKTNLYDTVLINLSYEAGLEVLAEVSWIFPLKKREIIIVGENDSIIFDDMKDNKLTYFKNLGEEKSLISYPSYPKGAPLTIEVIDFINSIEKNSKPLSDTNLGVKIAQILSLAELSIKKGGEFVRNNEA